MGSDQPSKIWGRRAYVDKQAREMLNDVSREIAAVEPPHIDSPDDPQLSDILRYIQQTADVGEQAKGETLVDLVQAGLTFEEAVVWYWFRYCGMDLGELYTAQRGHYGGRADYRQRCRKIMARLLQNAASLLDVDPSMVPDPADPPEGQR